MSTPPWKTAAYKKRRSVYEKYNRRCAYCGVILKLAAMQVDHIHPKSLGGSDDFENLMPSCRSCNYLKATHSVDEFRERIISTADVVMNSPAARLAQQYGQIIRVDWRGPVVFYFEEAEVQS